jgi:cell division protein FtsL
MTKRIIVVIFIVSLAVFFHYQNNHHILKFSRKANELKEVLKSKNDINIQLITVNSKLSSRDRIQKIAFEKLGMFFPITKENVHTIKINKKDNRFCLVDYIIPSVEALEN